MDPTLTLLLHEGPDGTTLAVRVQPRAKRPGVLGVREGALVLGVSAPPVDGAANDAVLRLLAREILSMPTGGLLLVRGERSRDKVVLIRGRTAEAVRDALRRVLLPSL